MGGPALHNCPSRPPGSRQNEVQPAASSTNDRDTLLALSVCPSPCSSCTYHQQISPSRSAPVVDETLHCLGDYLCWPRSDDDAAGRRRRRLQRGDMPANTVCLSLYPVSTHFLFVIIIIIIFISRLLERHKPIELATINSKTAERKV